MIIIGSLLALAAYRDSRGLKPIKYRLVWKSRVNGNHGVGDWYLSKEMVEKWATNYNRKHPHIEHRVGASR